MFPGVKCDTELLDLCLQRRDKIKALDHSSRRGAKTPSLPSALPAISEDLCMDKTQESNNGRSELSGLMTLKSVILAERGSAHHTEVKDPPQETEPGSRLSRRVSACFPSRGGEKGFDLIHLRVSSAASPRRKTYFSGLCIPGL